MKFSREGTVLFLTFVLLSSLLVAVNAITVPQYPEPVLAELPAMSEMQADTEEKEKVPEPVLPTESAEEYNTVAEETARQSQPEAPSFPMSINHATKEELMFVKGIGEKTAEKILAYLAQYGPVSDIAQLDAVKGIGPKTIEKLQEYFYAP